MKNLSHQFPQTQRQQIWLVVRCIQELVDHPDLNDRHRLLDRYRTVANEFLENTAKLDESAVNEFMLRKANSVLSIR